MDAAGHADFVESELVLLARAESVDQKLVGVDFEAVVEEEVLGDCGEGLGALVSGVELDVVLSGGRGCVVAGGRRISARREGVAARGRRCDAGRGRIADLLLCHGGHPGAVLLVGFRVSSLASSVAIVDGLTTVARPGWVGRGAGCTDRHFGVRAQLFTVVSVCLESRLFDP